MSLDWPPKKCLDWPPRNLVSMRITLRSSDTFFDHGGEAWEPGKSGKPGKSGTLHVFFEIGYSPANTQLQNERLQTCEASEFC